MKKPTARFIFMAIVLWSLPFSGRNQAFAQDPPERTPSNPGGVGPLQVVLYLEANYVKPIGTWTLAPGTRMLRVPSIAQPPGSIALGSQVGAVVFPNRDYTSSTWSIWSYDQYPEGQTNPKFYLNSYMRYKGSTPSINKKTVSAAGCSFVLYRLDIPDLLGIYLEASSTGGQFYPLPDRAGEYTAFYDKIPEGGPWILSFVEGGPGGMSLYPSTSPPNPNNVEIAIKTPSGLNLKLPEPNSPVPQHDLRSLGVDRQISSLMIRYIGPVNDQDYREPVRVRAPAVPTIPPSIVSGTWTSSIGAGYEFQQNGNTFTWSAPSLGQKGSGSISGKDISTQWVGNDGPGSAKGQITQVDAGGAALRIEWDNGVAFFRQGAAAAQKPQKIQALPLQPRAVDVSGTWKGPSGVTYQITQNDVQFTWVVAATGEKGNGTLNGMVIAAKWSSLLSSGSAKGEITQVDAGGAALRIEWDNGVAFFRQGAATAQKPQQIQALPLQPRAVDVSGTWKGPSGVTYQITQNDVQFTWVVAATGEKGAGTLNGMAIGAKWSSLLSSGSGNGKIIAVDANGRAIRIEWDNGVVFLR